MFKNIQHKLLLRYPLLWNMRIVPVIIAGLLLNIIFFAWGFDHGAVDFGPENSMYYIDPTPAIVIMLSVVMAVLIVILWLVFYLRNNAFKSYYPIKGKALYKEWLLLVLACIINCTYSLSFMYGQDIRGRSYFSEEEFSHRIDVISMVSLFADGGFEDDGVDQTWVNDRPVYKKRNYTTFRGKRYPLNSLLNKETADFSYQRDGKDSLNQDRVKGWLAEGRKDSVLWLMKEFDKIVKDHKAKTSLTPEKWLELVYNYPAFSKYITVGRIERYEVQETMRAVSADNVPYEEEVAMVDYAVEADTVTSTEEYIKHIDTISNYIRVIDSVTYIYPKYAVPLNQLEHAYANVSQSYVNPEIDRPIAMAYVCFAMGLSLLIFSFRVTSGRAWLIALVAFGLAALLTAFVTFAILEKYLASPFFSRNQEMFYFILWLCIVLGLLLYFLSGKRSKGHTAIVLNILLWLTPFVLPVLLFTAKEIVAYYTWKRYTGEYDDYWMAKHMHRTRFEAFIEDNPVIIISALVLGFVIFMYFFTNAIKRWKGLAES